ncbi:required for excision 1-B domain-containing protein-like [Dreissena polymorpha]|uniref:Uncharacterized protein n=1 Tax=Dreissena polymorpha TaxID=45954 RepID=A0A9D3Y751_DREPO|nr:required for excision 1-B domain-containing protein-like [Dreissena polymorpha]XP_052258476.1 required for excision 1-B domain-containing protein-like [Dreissena polymorpha]KAH3693189.1 hypothetical protein DPMN_192591 [Dreissena polymorpha]
MGELTVTEGQASDSETTPKQMLSRFYSLQEERVQTYQLFEEGFQAYLKGAPNYNFPLFRRLVHEITETFNKISVDILLIKKKFSEQNNLLGIADVIGKIQDIEKTKIELVAKLQLVRQRQIDEPSETVESENETVKTRLKEVRDQLVDLMEELKYESEDLYVGESNHEVTESPDSRNEVER